ncbi:MAG: efflux RND transporter permease subunit [Betaproteobacteria bacterium]|nr:efflux RND transporter permease subunit [Betaproteobacteria bacterium]
MVERLIAWSARNPFLIGLMTLALLAGGTLAVLRTPLDALPDLSDVQVIVYTEVPGQAPQVVEDQVTYPLTTAMLSVPHSKVVRGFSFFGVSFVYVIFDDGTDIYWARSRVLEYLSAASGRLPPNVTPTLGPDATGVGWVYQYVLQAKSMTLGELRTLQDWFVRFQLTKAQGVSEVASVGGFVQQYQVIVDPARLRAYGLPLMRVAEVIRASNRDVGGRTIEMAETEYMVRGRGYLRGKADIEDLVLMAAAGTPVRVRDVARVELGPDERRGVAELNGEGEVVSGIAVARFGENALQVIDNVKQRIEEIKPGLPQGVEIVPVYDRSQLIHAAIATLTDTLVQESIIVALVCMLFLLHVRSALVVIVVLPLSVLFSFVCMRWLGINANIMSLGGIAIAIGELIDAAVVMVENAHKKLERREDKTSDAARIEAIVAGCREVGPALFFSLLIIAVSFLPVFTLQAQEGRLFAPLAYTKTFAMLGGALLSVTLLPMLMVWLIRGRILPESRNPISRVLVAAYRPVIDWVLRWRWVTIALAVVACVASIWPATRLGTEFMPTLNEGALFYMPTSLPGMSVTKAAELVQVQNKIIKSFPEVASVIGKAGRATSATDPAPLEMFETVINLKPESEWRPGLDIDKLIAEMDKALQFPGVANSWTMPIRARIDMLSTGIRTPVGIKVFGSDLVEMEKVAREIETVVRDVPGASSVYAERITGGFYLDIEPDRAQLARYGLAVGDLMDVVASALGGEIVTTTVEGRARFGVSVRYPRDARSTPEAIERQVLLTLPAEMGQPAATIPLGQVAKARVVQGAPVIRTENSLLSAYIYVDIRERDIGGFVKEAQRVVRDKVAFPQGMYVTWSGQFEYLERAVDKLKLVVPLTLVIIFVLLYLSLSRVTEAMLVMLAVPFSLVGGVWYLWALDYNLSVAVAVGFIALAGVAAETGVVMLVYIDNAWKDVQAQCKLASRLPTRAELHEAVVYGAVERVRPKIMTVVTTIAALAPVMWATGTGSEIMRRIAAPMVGGMVSSTVLTLVVIPALYSIVLQRRLAREERAAAPAGWNRR